MAEYDLAADLASAKAQTTAIYGDQYSVNPPTYQTPNVPTQPTAAIPMTSLEPVAPIQLPQTQPQVSPLEPTTASATQTSKTLQDYITELTPPTTELDTQQQSLINSIQGLLPQTTSRGQAQLQAETQAGIPQLKTQLADLNAQILAKVAEANKSSAVYDKMIAQYETQPGMLTSVVTGQQAAAQKLQLADARTKSADIALLQARASGLQGNLTALQENVDRSVDLRYQDVQDQLNLKMKQLEMLQPLLDKQEKVQAQALQRKYEDEQARIEEEKQKAKENLSLIFTSGLTNRFINRQGRFIRAADGKSYSSPAEFFKDAGVKSFEEAYQRGLVGDLTSDLLADRDSVLKLRETYPDAGINISDDWQTAVGKLDNSYKYSKETYIEAPKGEQGLGTVRLKGPDGVEVDYFVGQNGELIPAVGGDYNGIPNSVLTAKESKDLDATTEVKALKSLSDLRQAIADYDKIIKQEGFALTGAGKAKLDQAYATVKILWKEAANLGALTGPDVGLITEAVPKATGLSALNPFGPNVKGVRNVLNDAVTIIDRNARNKYEQLTLRNEKYEYNPYVQSLGKPFGLQPIQDTSNFIGPTFNSAGNASASNQVKGWSGKVDKLPLLNLDGSPKTPNVPLTKAYPQGSYPSGKKNSLANQCGYFVRSIVNKMGLNYPSVGDSLKEKMNAVRKYGSKTGSVGSVLITNESKKNGHVAYIIGKTAKGWVLGESNYKLDGKINYGRVIPFNSPSIVGYIQPNKKA